MSPEDAKAYLKFLKEGSTAGLTDAERLGIQKVDDALALNKLDYGSPVILQNPQIYTEGGTSILPQYGHDFGEMGIYVENPNIKVDWTQYAEHAAERMQQRGMTQEMVNNIARDVL